MSDEKKISIGATHYLLTLLRSFAMQQTRIHSTMYNYYDGFQVLTAELVELGFAHVWESLDDEWSAITKEGYLCLRHRQWLTEEEIARLDTIFEVKP